MGKGKETHLLLSLRHGVLAYSLLQDHYSFSYYTPQPSLFCIYYILLHRKHNSHATRTPLDPDSCENISEARITS